MYKRLRYYFRFTTALLAKYYLAIILGLVVGITTFIALPELFTRLPRMKTTKRIAYVGRFTASDLPLTIQQKISIGLTSINDSGLPSPAVASGWQVQEEGKTYTFSLDGKLKWHDGSPIKSRDVQFRFKDAEVEYPDDSTIVIRLEDPFSPLPIVVSRPVFKSPAAPKYLGAGAYRLKALHKNGNLIESLTLYPVENPSQLPRLQYIFYPSPQAARTALKLGLVDTIEDIQEIGELSSWPNLTVSPQTLTDRYVAVFFNTAHPDLVGASGKNLRLALAYAIDKSRWPNRALGPIGANSWAYNSDVKRYDQDLGRSRELLDKVEKVPEEITLSTVPSYLPVSEEVKSDWEKLGIRVNIQVQPEIPEDFTVLLVAQAIPLDPDQYNFWHSTQDVTNLTNLNNPRIDKLLEDGRKTLDLKERQLIYQDFQRFLLEETPAVFLFHPQTYHIYRH